MAFVFPAYYKKRIKVSVVNYFREKVKKTLTKHPFNPK